MQRLAILVLVCIPAAALAQPPEEPPPGAAVNGQPIDQPVGQPVGQPLAPDGGMETIPDGGTDVDGGAPPALASPSPAPPAPDQRSPGFTQDREFATTRLWTLDPGKLTAELSWNAQWGATNCTVACQQPASNADLQVLQAQLAIGIVPHVEADISASGALDEDSAGRDQITSAGRTGIAAELRVAVPDRWGEIWGNPTLDAALTMQYANSPRGDFRLLLAGTVLNPRLLGALDLAFERNLFRDPLTGIDYEIKADWGLNYEVVRDIFRLGLEGVVGFDSHGDIISTHATPSTVFIGGNPLHPLAWVGPSLLLTEPGKHLKLLLAALKGLADWDQQWYSTVALSTTF